MKERMKFNTFVPKLFAVFAAFAILVIAIPASAETADNTSLILEKAPAETIMKAAPETVVEMITTDTAITPAPNEATQEVVANTPQKNENAEMAKRAAQQAATLEATSTGIAEFTMTTEVVQSIALGRYNEVSLTAEICLGANTAFI